MALPFKRGSAYCRFLSKKNKVRSERNLSEKKENKISIHCILACIYFLALPLTIWTNSYGASLLKLITIPIGGYFLASFVFYKKEFEINLVHLLLVIYTISTLLTLFIDRSTESIEFVIGYFLNAAIYICMTVVSYNERELEFFENTQIAVLALITGWVLYSNSLYYERTTLAIFGQVSDPNYFVGYFIFPLVVTMKKIVHSKYRVLYLLLMVLSLYVVFQSGSRGGFVAVLITIAAFALIYPEKIKFKIWLLLVGIGFFALLWNVLSPMLPDKVLERMSVDAVIESRGTHRFDIWVSALNQIKNSSWELIFGRGINAMHTMIIAGTETPAVIHNQFIQVIYSQGVIGFVTFFALTGAAFMRCIKRRKIVSIAIIGMLALAVSLSFNQTTRTFWNIIAYSALVFPRQNEDVKYKEESKNEEMED